MLSTCSVGALLQKLQLRPWKGQRSNSDRQEGCLGCRGCLHVFPEDACARRGALGVLWLYSPGLFALLLLGVRWASCRAFVCLSAEAWWLWVLWSKCPCGTPSLASPAPFQLSGFPQTHYCNLFCFCPSSPTAPIRNKLAKKTNLCLLACSKPALGCCAVMPPGPPCVPLALVAPAHPTGSTDAFSFLPHLPFAAWVRWERAEAPPKPPAVSFTAVLALAGFVVHDMSLPPLAGVWPTWQQAPAAWGLCWERTEGSFAWTLQNLALHRSAFFLGCCLTSREFIFSRLTQLNWLDPQGSGGVGWGWGWSRAVPLPRQQPAPLGFSPGAAVRDIPAQPRPHCRAVLWGWPAGVPQPGLPSAPSKLGCLVSMLDLSFMLSPPPFSLESGGRTLVRPFLEPVNEAA